MKMPLFKQVDTIIAKCQKPEHNLIQCFDIVGLP